MVSLRFPFSFPKSAKPPNNPNVPSRCFSPVAMAGSVAAVAGIGITLGLSISQKNTDQKDPFLQNALDFFLSRFKPNASSSSPLWASLSLADTCSEVFVESKTATSFPTVLDDTQRLVGVGLRKKSVFGLKNIDVYAFGVYADDSDIKNMLGEKYSKLSVSELKENTDFHEDIMNNDICMTVRLQIVYGRLSMRTVRSSFEESIGSKLQKFGGTDNKELLQRFTSLLKEEIKLPRGSVINLSRERGHILRTTINGEEVGKIQSKLLCRAVLDLYIGKDPFDPQAKEDTELNLASLLLKMPPKTLPKKTPVTPSAHLTRQKRKRINAASASDPPPQQAPTIVSTEGYAPFLDGAELPPNWKNYNFLPLVPEKYFHLKDIVEKTEYGKFQLGDAAKLFKAKELFQYAKPQHMIYPSLTKLFYATLRYEDPNIHVKIGDKAFVISEDDVVNLFKHSAQFLEESQGFYGPSSDADKYPSLSAMTQELFMLEHTNKRHHLKDHTHILLHQLIQSNILPSLGSKDVLSKDVLTLLYGIVNKPIVPAHSIFARWITMTRSSVVSLPYPSLITAILSQKGYKIPENITEGWIPKMFKAGDWRRGFSNSFNERAKVFRIQKMPLTKGLVIGGEVLEVQPVDAQASSSTGPSNAEIYSAINTLKGLVISNQKEVRSRLAIIENKFGVQEERFNTIDVNVSLVQAGVRALCDDGQVEDDDFPILDDYDDVLIDVSELVGDASLSE